MAGLCWVIVVIVVIVSAILNGAAKFIITIDVRIVEIAFFCMVQPLCLRGSVKRSAVRGKAETSDRLFVVLVL